MIVLAQRNVRYGSEERAYMRLRLFGLIFSLGFLQLWLLPYPGFAYITPANGETGGIQVDPQCQVTVLIRGGGTVDTLLANDQRSVLSSYNNPVDVPCDELVALSAEPSEFWLFEGWEGISPAARNESSITAASGQVVTAVFRPLGLYYETVDVPYFDRNGRLTNQVPKIRIPEALIIERGTESPVSAEPVINVWYGETQPFGQIGMSQNYVNILGNVFDPDGVVSSLKYSLNGGPDVPLTIGPDARRLQELGDFNIDIDETLLQEGENSVLITAIDNSADQTQLEVTVNYDGTNVWPLPDYVDWDVTGEILDAGQVVDGQWSVLQNGIRNDVIGYDRVVAIGDQNWTDYEAQVEIQVQSVDPRGFDPGNAAPAIGLFMHWKGHTDLPPVCDPAYRPKCGWLPAIASWYEWDKDQMGGGQFSMWLNHNQKKSGATSLIIEEGENYIWKIRVESSNGSFGKYKFKVWHEDDPEPANWFKELNGQADSPQSGSILLAAHYVQMIFRNVTITPLNGQPDVTPPVISDVIVSEEPDGATVHWKTDEPATSTVNYGETAAYGETVTDSALKTEHYLYLDNLDSEEIYHFEVSSSDNADNTATENDDSFTTQQLISIVSDDFNYCELDSNWEFLDPLDDSDLELTTTEINLNVPGGTAHDIWAEQGQPLIRAPRLIRDVTDPNNLQVKFSSGVSAEVQFQGVLIEEDENTLFRVSYQFNNGKTDLYVIGHRDGQNSILKKAPVNGANSEGPLYFWIMRENGQWHVQFSLTGTEWDDAGFFDFPLAVNRAGVFAGNVSGPSEIPPVNAQVDYWFDANNPIAPEDQLPLSLPVNIQGNGSVAKNVECGNPVTLTATADPGWTFVRWIGSPINGQTNPEVTVEFDFDDQVTALFEPIAGGPFNLETTIIGQGTVIKNPDKTLYDLNESVTVTAQAENGWQFDHWEGSLSGSETSKTMLMDGNKSVTAVFVEKEAYALEIEVSGGGTVVLSPDKPAYNFAEVIQLSAIADQGWRFVRWEGDISGTENVVQVQVTGDLFVRAIFVQEFEQAYLVHLPFIKR